MIVFILFKYRLLDIYTSNKITNKQILNFKINDMKKTTLFKTVLLTIALVVFNNLSWGATATYTIDTKTTVVTSGATPIGSSATYSQTYGTVGQMTSPNSTTLTLSGYVGNKITSVVLSMKSNTSKGAGTLSVVAGTTNIVSISPAAKFNDALWNGGWSTSYVDVTKTPVDYSIGSGEDLVITIAATENSLYIDKYTINYESATSCTTSNLVFANPTVSKLATDPAFTIAATSLNLTTEIAYSSDNLAVALVSATTGEVTLIGQGQAKITAIQAAGTHNAVDYCAASASYDLTVNSAAPTITISDVTELVLQTTVGNTDSETMQVSAINMTNDVMLTITGTDAAMFSVTPVSITPSSGTVTNTAIVINYNPTVQGNHTATLNISSTGAETVTRSLSGTSTWAPLAKPVLTGATNVGKTALTLNWDVVNGASSYEVNVYSKAGGGSQNVLTENFNGFAAGTIATPNGTDVGPTLDTYTQTSGWTGSKVYQAAGTAKMGTSSVLGSLTTPVLDLSANSGAFKISFKAMAWSGDANSLKIYLNDVLLLTPSIVLNNDATYTLSSFSVDLTGGTSTSKIKFEGNVASKGRFFIEDLVISQGGSSVVPVSGSPFTVSTNSKDLTGLTAATNYYYTVQAKNTNVTSEVSGEQQVSTLATSVYSPSGKLQLRIVNGQAVFEASANQTFEVYNSVGQKLVSTRTTEGLNKLSINAKGVVIIKIDNEIVKVVL